MNELRAKRFDLAIAASVRENVLRDAEKFLAIDESGILFALLPIKNTIL